MPRNIESIDDEPLLDGTANFGGGLNSYTARNQLAPTQFAIGRNTVVDRAGIIRTRRGTSALGSLPAGTGQALGMAYLETPAGVKKLLVCFQGTGSGTTVRTFDGTTWTTIAGYTPVAGYNVEIVQGLDKLYLTDTTQNIFSWDGAAWVNLGNGATDAPRAKFIVWGTNRLIAAGVPSAPDTVYFSDLLDPSSTHWSAANRIRVGAGDGDPITGIAMLSKTILAVFKRTRIFLVDINPSLSVSTFTIDEVPTTYGCVHYRTIAKVGNDLWFLSNDGVRSLSRTLQGDDSSVSAPISLPIKNLTALIPDTYLELTNATYFQGRYLLAHWANFTAPDGTPTGYYTLSYNVELQQWEGRWDGLLTVLMTQTRFAGILRLVFAATTGTLTYFRHENGTPETAADYQDDAYLPATEIPTRIGTRAHNHGANFNGKRGFVTELEFDECTAPSAAVKLALDYAAPTTLATVTPNGRVPLTLLHQSPFREAAVEVESTSGKLALRSVSIASFAQTMPAGT